MFQETGSASEISFSSQMSGSLNSSRLRRRSSARSSMTNGLTNQINEDTFVVNNLEHVILDHVKKGINKGVKKEFKKGGKI